MKTEFPDPNDVLNFKLTIDPDEGMLAVVSQNDELNFQTDLPFPPSTGMYKTGSFNFTFAINSSYPHEPPKVKCTQKVSSHLTCQWRLALCFEPKYSPWQIYHPNLDLDGNVCLNILREDWKPVLNLNSIMVGLQYLFLEPNADDPLNKGELPHTHTLSAFCEVTLMTLPPSTYSSA